MRFLKIKKRSRRRQDGSVTYTPLIVDAPRRFAKTKERKETTLSVKKCQLIMGAHDSGKTRWLTRLHEKWAAIWGSSVKSEPVFLSAIQPISSWTDQKSLEQWHDAEEKKAAETDHEYTPKYWASLNAQKKAARIPEYIAETKTILFLDDAHKLTGRKLELARQCVIVARIWLISCSQENRLPPSLRPIVERREPQRTKLNTDTAYDATNLVMWLFVAIAVGIGWWEVALVLGGLKILGSGRRAARPD